MFARFEDSTVELLRNHFFWKCDAVCLSGLESPDFSKVPPRMWWPPEGLNVKAVRSFETLGMSNPVTQLDIPENLNPLYYVCYTVFEGKGFVPPSGRAV